MTEQNKEEILEIDADQLQEYMNDSDKLPPIEIPFEFYNTDDFYKGIEDYSYISGAITALLNTGVSESFVLDYLLHKQTIEHNLKAAELNKEMSIEISKNQRIMTEKNEL
jgi:hypothetical protein